MLSVREEIILLEREYYICFEPHTYDDVSSYNHQFTRNHLLQALAPPIFLKGERNIEEYDNDTALSSNTLIVFDCCFYKKDENMRFLMGSSESVELYGPIWIVLTYVLVCVLSIKLCSRVFDLI